MSRAFVKDAEDAPEPVIDRPVSEAPNYVTPHGLDLLKEALAKAQAQENKRDVRYYEKRIETAILIDPATQSNEGVEFGRRVVARDDGGNTLQFQIVGEDEADPTHGLISHLSPVAQALMHHRAGDRVTVARPAGRTHYTIVEIV